MPATSAGMTAILSNKVSSRPLLSSIAFVHERAPSAQVRNILCAGGRVGLHQKSLDLAAAGERECADRKRRRNVSNKSSERIVAQRPQLDLDGAAAALSNAQQS